METINIDKEELALWINEPNEQDKKANKAIELSIETEYGKQSVIILLEHGF